MTPHTATAKTWSRPKRTRYLSQSLQRLQQSFLTWRTLSGRTTLWQHSFLKCKRSLPNRSMLRLHWLWHVDADKLLMKRVCPSLTNKGALWPKIQSLQIIMSYPSPSCPKPPKCLKRQRKTNRPKQRNQQVAQALQNITYKTKRHAKLGARGSSSWLGVSICIDTNSLRIHP